MKYLPREMIASLNIHYLTGVLTNLPSARHISLERNIFHWDSLRLIPNDSNAYLTCGDI